MRTHGVVVKGHEIVVPYVDLEAVKEWAKRTLSKERIAEVVLVAATLVVTGYLGSVIFKGIETYSMSGF